MLNDFFIYSTLAMSSFINIIVPISGSSTVTPFLAILTDPHRAIGLASFYFVLSGVIRVYFFRKDIQWQEIKHLLLPSLIAGVLGATSLVVVNSRFLLVLVLCFVVFFLFKKLHIIKKKENKTKTLLVVAPVVGFFSGFLQGAGLAGSDLRNGYLYSKGLSISQLHGTTAFIGASIFSIATIVRLSTNQLTIPDLIPLLYIFPFILIGTIVGRHVLYKINKEITDKIIISIMLIMIFFLVMKIIGL